MSHIFTSISYATENNVASKFQVYILQLLTKTDESLETDQKFLPFDPMLRIPVFGLAKPNVGHSSF
jgi:hypothetical protein